MSGEWITSGKLVEHLAWEVDGDGIWFTSYVSKSPRPLGDGGIGEFKREHKGAQAKQAEVKP